MRGRDARLVAPACVAWAVAWLLSGTTGWSTAVAIIFGLGGLVGLLLSVKHRVLAVVAVAAAAGMLAALAVAVALPSREVSALDAAIDSGATVRAVVELTQNPRRMAGFIGHADPDASSMRVRFEGRLVDAEIGRETIRGSVPVSVVGSVDDDHPTIGSRVAVTTSIRSAEHGDSASYRLFASDPIEMVASPPGVLAWADTLRAGFRDLTATLPGGGGELLPGLAIGDTSRVSSELDEAMKASSLSHLTAVSGANCAIVVAAVMMLASLLRLPRGVRIGAAVAALVAFIILVTPESSVVRAGVMALIVLVALARGRPGGGLPALCLAVVVLLVIDPWMSRDYGFALSVLATGGLLVLTAPLSRVLERCMPSSLAGILAIPLAAQVACQPVVLLLEPSLPLYGVAANLLAAPAAPAGTVLGLLACILLPVLPGVAFACAQIAWVPASWIASIAETTESLPGARLPWLDGAVGFILFVVLTFAVLVAALAGRRLARARWIALAVVVIAVGAYAGSVVVAPRLRAGTLPAEWSVAACDVGQGDAVVVRSGDVHVLVDSGPDPDALSQCLSALGIDRIDVFAISHFDLDHVGGTEAIVGRVDAVVIGGVPDARGDEILTKLADAGAEVHTVVAGDGGRIGGVSWKVLWPDPTDPAAEAGNDASVALVVDAGGVRSLFLGDLGEDSQRALLATSAVPDVDVVKVAHHGSGDQLVDIYRHARAEVGLISVGADNGYGHPAESILRTLKEMGTHALRTDQRGLTVIARSDDGSGLSAWFERSPPGRDAAG